MARRTLHYAQIAIKEAPLPRFSSIKAAHCLAKQEGCDLSLSTFSNRYKAHPDMPWGELVKPAVANRSRAVQARSRHQQQIDEAAEICRKLDERKRALAPSEEPIDAD